MQDLSCTNVPASAATPTSGSPLLPLKLPQKLRDWFVQT